LARKVAGQSGDRRIASGIVHDVLAMPGSPLDERVRNDLEPRFGRDFSGVRVHNDAQAARSAKAVGALAYTVGQHIVFSSGRYRPATRDGMHLLIHEMAHVVRRSLLSTSAAIVLPVPLSPANRALMPSPRLILRPNPQSSR
jgi:hypothetical protein